MSPKRDGSLVTFREDELLAMIRALEITYPDLKRFYEREVADGANPISWAVANDYAEEGYRPRFDAFERYAEWRWLLGDVDPGLPSKVRL